MDGLFCCQDWAGLIKQVTQSREEDNGKEETMKITKNSHGSESYTRKYLIDTQSMLTSLIFHNDDDDYDKSRFFCRFVDSLFCYFLNFFSKIVHFLPSFQLGFFKTQNSSYDDFFLHSNILTEHHTWSFTILAKITFFVFWFYFFLLSGLLFVFREEPYTSTNRIQWMFLHFGFRFLYWQSTRYFFYCREWVERESE